MRGGIVLIFAYALIASVSAYGFPWNLPAVLVGAFFVGWRAGEWSNR